MQPGFNNKLANAEGKGDGQSISLWSYDRPPWRMFLGLMFPCNCSKKLPRGFSRSSRGWARSQSGLCFFSLPRPLLKMDEPLDVNLHSKHPLGRNPLVHVASLFFFSACGWRYLVSHTCEHIWGGAVSDAGWLGT